MGVLEQDLLDDSKSIKDVIVADEWLTPIEVAGMFGVTARTVNKWNNDKLVDVRKFKTPGNHTRYYKPDVLAILEKHENSTQSGR